MPRPDHDADDAPPRLAIRRHTDRCFHEVEEVVPGGYIVEGILIAADEVADVRSISDVGCGMSDVRSGGRPASETSDIPHLTSDMAS